MINYALGHDGDISEDEKSTQSSAEPDPQSIDDAVKKYRDRTVEALFDELGLAYWKFCDQVMRQDSREQEHRTDLEKRSHDGSSSSPSRPIKKNIAM